MNLNNHRQNGFVLIIVVAVLGILVHLAINLMHMSMQAQSLSHNHVMRSRARLMARSGLEFAMSRRGDLRGQDSRQLGMGTASVGGDSFMCEFRDASGSLNVNDGIATGRSLLGGSYVSTALQPVELTTAYEGNADSGPYSGVAGSNMYKWMLTDPNMSEIRVGNKAILDNGAFTSTVIEVGQDVGMTYVVLADPDPVDPDGWGRNCFDFKIEGFEYETSNPTLRSAQCNLRIRRLLNAYGDAHRYLDFLNGEPPSIPSGVMSGFTFSGNDALPTGNELHPGQGLGDQLILQRPPAGYESRNQFLPILDQWGESHLGHDYLLGRPFSSICSNDLILHSHIDTQVFSLRRHFAPLWNDFTHSSKGPSGKAAFAFLDAAGFDFSPESWVQEHVSVINPSAASRMVLAAMLYSCADVYFLGEHSKTLALGGIFNDAHANYRDSRIARPSVVLAGCVFRASRMTENGDLAVAEPNRLMSMRDALLLSKNLEQTMLVNPPQTRGEFRSLLTDMRTSGVVYERAEPTGTAFNGHPDEGFFTQDYVEKVLPDLLAPSVRIPGFLGAPAPMLSSLYETTYAQVMDLDTVEQSTDRSNGFLSPAILRSVSDFVPRWHLPKVQLCPSGIRLISSQGRILDARGVTLANASLYATVKFHELIHIRSQSDFNAITDPDTDSLIVTGPNNTTRSGGVVAPDVKMGYIGLNDMPVTPAWSVSPQIVMNFSGNLLPEPFTNPPQSPTVSEDGFLNSPFPQYPRPPYTVPLLNSRPEANEPLLNTLNDSGDISPAGGLLLGSLGHGFKGPRFADSLYWRLYGPSCFPNQIMDSSQAPGVTLGRGFVHLWFRIPTGSQFPSDLTVSMPSSPNYPRSRRFRHVLAHMRAWECNDQYVSGLHFKEYMWNPVDIMLYYSFNTITQRHEIRASYTTIERLALPNPSFYRNFSSGVYELVPLEKHEDDPAITLDNMTIPFPYLAADYGKYLLGGPRVFIKTVVLRDSPENGPGTWHSVSMGWDLSRLQSGDDWRPSRFPYDDKFWVRLHDHSNAESYYADFDVGMWDPYPLLAYDYNRGVRDRNKIDGPVELYDGNMVFSIGESQCRPINALVPYNDAFSHYHPIWRLNSSVDNIRAVFGELPSIFNGFDAIGYTTGIATDYAKRTAIDSEPTWIIRLPIPVGSKIQRISAGVFVPTDSAQESSSGPNVPCLDMHLSTAGSDETYLPHIHTCDYINHLYVDSARFHIGYKNQNILGLPLHYDGVDNCNEFPWIHELTVSYLPPRFSPVFLHFSMD